MFIIVCFMVIFVRLADINQKDFSAALGKQSTRTLIISEKRGEIYDRNFESLVNCEKKLVAAVTPCNQAYSLLKNEMNPEILKEKIEDGYPFLCEVKKEINNEIIKTFSVPTRYTDDGLACHIIGYLDSDGENGVTGVERAYNEYLKQNSGSLKVSFDVDGLGRVLAGMKKEINDNNFTSKAGVVLTVDKKVQQITESALKNSNIKSGCAAVMHIDTGEIFALASVPSYNQNNVAASLNEGNSPFVNKALQSYSAGSVFKPIVAAAALENGYNSEAEYECTGEITVGDTVFECYNHKAHGKVDMKKALADSCNTYFVNLIMNTDADYLLSLCRNIGFSQSDVLASTVKTASGTLPTENELSLKGELANFAFGQGSLLVTPIQILKAYHVLATGNYAPVNLVKGFTNSMGLMTSQKYTEPVKLLSDETVLKMREMLTDVVYGGNAENAKSDLLRLAGKTGTAQSGVYKNGKEICRTWFAGFFPANNPHYIVVVMNEDGEGGNCDCAGVFKTICENMVTQ